MITHRIPSYLNAAWANQWSAGTYSSSTVFTVSGNVTSAYVADNAIRILNAGTLYYSYVVSSAYATGTTTITIADAVLVSGTISSDYSILPNNSAVGRAFQEVKVVGSRGFSVWNGGSNTVSITQAGVVTAISFSGNGANLTALKWVNLTGVPSLVNSFNGRTGAVSPVPGDYSLSQIGTVSLTSPSNGQILQYNGTNWVNTAAPSAPVTSVFGRTNAVTAQAGDYSLAQIGSVSLTSPSANQVLQYNGTNWVNAVVVTTAFSRNGAITAQASDYSAYYGQLATANTWTSTNTFNGAINGTSASFSSTISASNFSGSSSGTNTGDQNLAPYALLSGASFTGAISSSSTVSGSGGSFINGSSEADIHFGPNGTYLYSTSGTDFGIYNPTYSTLFSVSSVNGNGVFKGIISASNFSGSSSGTNTGDQNLAPYALLSGAAFSGSISASNFSGSSSGTNTGDQNLAPYALLSGATFTGLVTNTGSYIREYYGASGNYSAVGLNTWGGPIWGMDTGYTGGVGAANWSPTGVYGIAWQRSGSSNANSSIGEGLYVYVNGSLYGGIGTTGIYTSGTIVNSGVASFNTSSLDIKTNVHKLDFDIENFMRYEPISYVHKDSQLSTDGFSAENIYEVNPKLVMLKDGKPYAVNYQGMIPHAVKVGQKHELDLRESKERISYLENRIQNLENKLNKLVN